MSTETEILISAICSHPDLMDYISGKQIVVEDFKKCWDEVANHVNIRRDDEHMISGTEAKKKWYDFRFIAENKYASIVGSEGNVNLLTSLEKKALSLTGLKFSPSPSDESNDLSTIQTILPSNNYPVINCSTMEFAEIKREEESSGESSIMKEYNEKASTSSSEDLRIEQIQGFAWNDRVTRLFLSIYAKKQDKFMNPHYKKKAIWEEIAASMRSHGYILVRTQCENKFKSLMYSYKRAKDNNRQPGKRQHISPFFHEMEKLFINSPQINPISCCSSLPELSSISSNAATDESQTTETEGMDESQTTETLETEGMDELSPLPKYLKRKKNVELEPTWFKMFRLEAQHRHEEKMELQRRFLDLFKILVEKM